jgi:hypothetical protein
MKGQWATKWVAWPQFSQFAGQLLSWVAPQSGSSGLEPTYSFTPASDPSSEDVSVQINSVDDNGHPRIGLDTAVLITDTASVSTAVDIAEGSPGVYDGAAKGLPPGVYQVGIQQRDHTTGDLIARDTSGFVVPYPSEYNIVDNVSQVSNANLNDLAQLGGGQVLSISEPGAAFTHDIASQPLRISLWPWLLLASILLFPFDVATRRLTINWRDLMRGGKKGIKIRGASG